MATKILILVLCVFGHCRTTTLHNATFQDVEVTLMHSRIYSSTATHDYKYQLTNLSNILISNSDYLMDNLRAIDASTYNTIKFEFQKIPVLWEGVFSDLNLLRLSIHGCEINEIHTGAFKNIKKLDIVEIDWVPLRTLKRGVFSNLPVQELLLTNDKIEEIQDGAFDGMTKLKILKLSSNYIKTLRAGLFSNLQELQVLYLSRNRIKDVEMGTFKNLPKLQEVHINENKIQRLDEGAFGNLPGLKVTLLNDNEIETINPCGVFKGSNNINKLDLSINQLKKIDQSFKCLRNIESLLIKFNQISYIQTDALDSFKNLEELDLFSNKLRKVSRGIFNIRTTKAESVISLGSNEITDIEEGAFERCNFTGIDLLENRIERIKANTFKNFEGDALGFNHNNISYIENGAFSDMLNLYAIDFRKNRLTEFKSTWFRNVPRLRNVQLSDNFLTREVNVEKFKYELPELEWVTIEEYF